MALNQSTLVNWSAQAVMEAVRYVASRHRFAGNVRNEIVPQGVEVAKFPTIPVGGSPRAGDKGLALRAPSQNMDLASVQINPNTYYESDTVDLSDSDLARLVYNRNLSEFSRDVLDKLTSYLDGQIYSGLVAGAGAYAQTNVLSANPDGAFQSTTDNLQALRNLYRAFQRMDVTPDEQEINVVISDNDYRNLLGQPNILQANFRGDAVAARTGMVSGVAGFGTIRGSSRTAGLSFGTANGRLVNRAGGYPLGYAGPIAFDTGSGTITAGDVVYFGGSHDTGDTYIVRSSTANSITLTRPLSAAIGNDDAINHPGTTRTGVASVGVAFSRGSMAFATRDLGSKNTGASVVATGRDAASGLSIRLLVETHSKGYRLGYDIEFGYGVLQPRYVALLGSSASGS